MVLFRNFETSLLLYPLASVKSRSQATPLRDVGCTRAQVTVASRKDQTEKTIERTIHVPLRDVITRRAAHWPMLLLSSGSMHGG
jgi:hypothetical protein